MTMKFLACSLIAVLAATTGCAMCGSPFDYTYSAHGGRWERDDPVEGRVGSAFAPAGAKADPTRPSTGSSRSQRPPCAE